MVGEHEVVVAAACVIVDDVLLFALAVAFGGVGMQVAAQPLTAGEVLIGVFKMCQRNAPVVGGEKEP